MKSSHLLSFALVAILATILIGCSGGATITQTVTQANQTVTETQTQTQSLTTTTLKELSTSEIVQLVSPSVAHIKTDFGAGTGMVIDERGYILTANHVVDVNDYATVRIPGRGQLSAEVKYRDSILDIAIIKCPGTGFPYVSLGSIESPALGDDVIAIGFPLSSELGEAASTSKGIISAFRNYDGIYYIQTDTPVNPGNSGGPLINIYGDVVGIVIGKMPDTEGLNFAIEVNSIKTSVEEILKQLVEGGGSIPGVTQTIAKTVTITAGATTITDTVTTTVGVGQTATTTATVTEFRFVCPIDLMEFDTLAELQAHFEAEHGSLTPTRTITVTTTVTQTPTTTPPTTTIPSGVVFTFTGVGERNTPPFSISTSPWILQYKTNFNGNFQVYLEGDNSGHIIGRDVTADEVYETYIYEKTGNTLYFRIGDAPTDGEWTLTVIKP